MKRVIAICLFIVLTAMGAAAQDLTLCLDKNSWKEWNELVQKYPKNADIQMLHAVRIGFCKKIKDGTIITKKAIDTFDKLHRAVYKKAKNEQERLLRNKQL